MLAYVSEKIPADDEVHLHQCLDFLTNRLGPRGVYHQPYTHMGYTQRREYRILPRITPYPLNPKRSPKAERMSPELCYSDSSCGVMGFPTIDPKLGDSAKLYGNLFQCAQEPEARTLLQQLLSLVTLAKDQQTELQSEGDKVELAERIEKAFRDIFKYLSHRSSDFSHQDLTELSGEEFILCRQANNRVAWFRPGQVFFRQKEGRHDELTEELFQLVNFTPFLAAVGGKQEATSKELFQLLLHDAKAVLRVLGSEKKYRPLLRRIASNPPFSRVSPAIRKAPFLLSYTLAPAKSSEKEKSSDAATYDLNTAENIFIIDNSFFGRMFPVPRAPHESDLEDFYAALGSSYISKSAERRFEVVGKPSANTFLSLALKERIMERAPLLVSPHVTSRPLVPDAASILDEKNLEFFQASNLMAVYSLRGVSRRIVRCVFREALVARSSVGMRCTLLTDTTGLMLATLSEI